MCQYNFNKKQILHCRFTPNSNYRIIRLDGNEINTVVEMDSGQGVFPLATDGKRHFFVIEVDSMESYKIVELEYQSLIEYPKAKGLVVGGALLDNKLYYTHYEENDDSHSLYKLDIEKKSNEPELILVGLSDSEVYSYNGEIYVTNKGKISSINNEKKYYESKSINFFDEENDILVQIEVQGIDLILQIVDCYTKEIIGTAMDPLDFDINNKEVTVYCKNDIITIDLRGQ